MEFLKSIRDTAEGAKNEAQKYARSVVSGDKYRFQEDGLDLDLTYITKNIIAMAFPATGAETAYRNDIKDVVHLLNKRHKGHFLIVNVSERNYDYSPLLKPEEVVFMGWLDHYPPPMDVLIQVVELMHNYLSAHPENVIAIHCMAGRSRTGTSIAAYFLYTNEFPSPQTAIDHFNFLRSQGPSLTLPSQIRAVYNFAKLLEKGRASGSGPITDFSLIKNPKKFILKSIVMTPIPLTGIKASGCKPVIEVYNRDGLTITPAVKPLKTVISSRKYRAIDLVADIAVGVLIEGDILIKFSHHSETFNHHSPLFRIQFHTSFVESAYLDFPLSSLDSPDSDLSVRFSPSQKILDESFRLRLLLEEVTPTPDFNTHEPSLEKQVASIIDQQSHFV